MKVLLWLCLTFVLCMLYLLFRWILTVFTPSIRRAFAIVALENLDDETGRVSEEGFTKIFRTGDKFWFIVFISSIGPSRISGPCIIDEIKKIELGETRFTEVTFSEKIVVEGQGDKIVKQKFPLSVLTDCWHGVFLLEEEAKRYLQEVKISYERNPKLIQKLQDGADWLEFSSGAE